MSFPSLLCMFLLATQGAVISLSRITN